MPMIAGNEWQLIRDEHAFAIGSTKAFTATAAYAGGR